MSNETTPVVKAPTILVIDRATDLGTGHLEFILLTGKKVQAVGPDKKPLWVKDAAGNDTKVPVMINGLSYLAPRKEPDTLEQLQAFYGRERAFRVLWNNIKSVSKELTDECRSEENPNEIDDQKFISEMLSLDAVGEKRSVLEERQAELMLRLMDLNEIRDNHVDNGGPDMNAEEKAEYLKIKSEMKGIGAALAKKRQKKTAATPALAVA